MKILVACEYTGTVRDALLGRGHDAISCDLLPTESPGPHHHGPVEDLINEQWDLVIAHPPCTYLSNSGVRWLHTEPGRWDRMKEAARFFRLMSTFRSPRIAIENPIQHKYAVAEHGLGRQTQIVQPWMFGHTETKATGLWLFGLPPLTPTENVKSEMAALPAKQRNRIHYLSPGADRWKQRSATFPGIADAMATQWAGNENV